MKNISKNNWKIDENTAEKFNRYGIRKYNVGAASVAILSGLFFLGVGAMLKQLKLVHLKQLPKLSHQRVGQTPHLILGKKR